MQRCNHRCQLNTSEHGQAYRMWVNWRVLHFSLIKWNRWDVKLDAILQSTINSVHLEGGWYHSCRGRIASIVPRAFFLDIIVPAAFARNSFEMNLISFQFLRRREDVHRHQS